MKKIIAVLLVLFCASCAKEEAIYYHYDGITITRIDKNAESYFYYDSCNNESIPCPNSFIRAEYSGFDGSMGGYLVFHPDKKVEILRMYGSFKEVGDTSLLYTNQYNDNYQLNEWIDSIRGNYDNRAWLSDVIEEEKDSNSNNKSRVITIYP